MHPYSWNSPAHKIVIVGLAVPLIAGRSRNERIGGYLAMVPALGLGLLGFAALFAFAALTSGVSA